MIPITTGLSPINQSQPEIMTNGPESLPHEEPLSRGSLLTQLKTMLSLEDDKVYPVLFDEKEALSIVPGNVLNLINHVLYQERNDESLPKIGQELVHEYFTRKILLTHPLEQRKAILQTLDLIQNFNKEGLPEVTLSPTMIPPEILLTVLAPLLDEKTLGTLYKIVVPSQENDRDALSKAILDRIHQNESFDSLGLSEDDEDLFLDTYGSRLSTFHLSSETNERIVSLMKKTPNIQHFTFSGDTAECLEHIPEILPDVESVTCSSSQLPSRKALEGLSLFHKLRELSLLGIPMLERPNVYDQTVATILDTNPQLQSLSFIESGPLVEHSLAKRTNIRYLETSVDSMSVQGISTILKMNAAMQALYLEGTDLPQSTLELGTSPLSNLSSLRLAAYGGGIEIMKKAPNLELFVGNSLDFDERAIENLMNSNKLRVLVLENTRNTPSFLRKTAKVEALFLHHIDGQEQFETLPNLENLEFFALGGNDLNEETLQVLLQKTKKLQRLHITASRHITGESLTQIPNLTTLKELHIEFCNGQTFSATTMSHIIALNPGLKVFCYSRFEAESAVIREMKTANIPLTESSSIRKTITKGLCDCASNIPYADRILHGIGAF